MCSKHGFGHTYKVSAWNCHHKCDIWHCVFSRDYFGGLAKSLVKQPLSATRKSFTSHRVESSPYFREGRMGILWRLEQTQCRCCKHQLCITKCPYYHHIVEMMLIVVIISPTHAPPPLPSTKRFSSQRASNAGDISMLHTNRKAFDIATWQYDSYTILYPLYTGAATFVPPLCDHKTPQVATEGTKETERLPWSFKGGTEDVPTSPWTPWSPWSFEHVQNSRTKEAGGRHTHSRGRRMDARWSVIGRPVK